MFRNPITAVGNPLLNNAGHGGRRSFIVVDEGELDGSFGFWAEDEDDGAEGFLDAHEDVFYVAGEQNESRFQRRFQGRQTRKDKKVKGPDPKAAAEAVVEENSSSHVVGRRDTVRKIMAKRIGLGKLKNPGRGQQTSLMMVGQQTQGKHGIRSRRMSK